MRCRQHCAACCIAPSISSLDKPAGIPCSHLDADLRCTLFAHPERPACCSGLQPSPEMCGSNRKEALRYLAALEIVTRPPDQHGAHYSPQTRRNPCGARKTPWIPASDDD